ncbi:hypothetical protein INN71_13675 [Nocardioides sp. ChNu-153]|uniref:hypothetical protein n=1 Tax=unclassified Nocardioides TaxID=2615069 RepID=UPI0024056A15|nr:MULTISPECIES: hypothetical protein [unclassified Nocardioides]MDF9714967.1 hypothetical protein [Nocardioides sp. ChNu-99]MDN7122436.1 hypothetical protein [Nocardioides sp. ChNu-153]
MSARPGRARGRWVRRTGVGTALVVLVATAACSSDGAGDGGGRGDASGTPVPGAGVPTDRAAAERFARLPADSVGAAVLADMVDVSTMQARVRTTHRGLDVVARVAVDADANCAGSLSIGDGTVELLRTGGDVHASFDQALLETLGHSPADAAAIVERAGDRWVLLDVASGLTDVGLACQAAVDALGGALFSPDGDADLSVDGLGELDGEPVLVVSRTDPVHGPTTARVRATTPHRYVQVETLRDGRPLVVDQVEYDAEVEVPVPEERGVVDSVDVGLS